jgi:hypothetical protein
MKLWHNGVLTHDIGKTIDFLCATTGATREKWSIMEIEFPQSKMVTGAGGKLRAAFAYLGDAVIELLQPLESDTYHAQTLKARGPGFHHNAYICEDNMGEVLESLIAAGGRKVWEFRDGDEHACYIEASDGHTVLEIINRCPFMPEK